MQPLIERGQLWTNDHGHVYLVVDGGALHLASPWETDPVSVWQRIPRTQEGWIRNGYRRVAR